MTSRVLDIILGVLAFIALALCMALTPRLVRAQEGAHGVGHAQMHPQYKGWRQPSNGLSCCNDSDCRPTRARGDLDGNWEAWDGYRWIPIPPASILKMQSPDGRSHLCEAGGRVFCFVPAGPKS